MSKIMMALILYGLAAYAASVTHDGFREGRMPALISSRVNPFVFDRLQVPVWFWAATVVNAGIAALLFACGLIVLLGGARA